MPHPRQSPHVLLGSIGDCKGQIEDWEIPGFFAQYDLSVTPSTQNRGFSKAVLCDNQAQAEDEIQQGSRNISTMGCKDKASAQNPPV